MLTNGPTNLGTRELPQALSATNIPAPLLAAESGNLAFLPDEKEYELPGGGKAKVFRWDGFSAYGAFVNLTGNYPDKNDIAVNFNRIEKITLLAGQVSIEVNGRSIDLKPQGFVIVGNGDRYTLTGYGQLIVTVLDLEGGTTKTVPRGEAS